MVRFTPSEAKFVKGLRSLKTSLKSKTYLEPAKVQKLSKKYNVGSNYIYDILNKQRNRR